MDPLSSLQEQVASQQQQLQELMGHVSIMSGQLNTAIARAEQAEKERGEVLRLAMAKLDGRQERPDAIVDVKGVGQPYKYAGWTDQDFSEWDYKMLTFLRAKFGEDIIGFTVGMAQRLLSSDMEMEDKVKTTAACRSCES